MCIEFQRPTALQRRNVLEWSGRAGWWCACLRSQASRPEQTSAVLCRSSSRRLSQRRTRVHDDQRMEVGRNGRMVGEDRRWGVDQIASGVPDVPLFQKGVATMITKECFGCEKVTSHEHLHDCAPGIPETHIVGSERFVCVLCKHVTFAGSDGASRFPFTFDKVAAGR